MLYLKVGSPYVSERLNFFISYTGFSADYNLKISGFIGTSLI